LSCRYLSPLHHHFILSLHTHTEHKSYVEASKFECWKQAMQV
jgi:hypothetical protein